MPTIPIPGFADPVSSLSHLAGVLAFGILAVPLLLRARGHPGRIAALAVFALGAVFLLSMSGVYHLLPDGSAGRYVLRHLDHAAIFFLIAATFTPVHVILFRGAWRWGMLALIWTVAATGITLGQAVEALHRAGREYVHHPGAGCRRYGTDGHRDLHGGESRKRDEDAVHGGAPVVMIVFMRRR